MRRVSLIGCVVSGLLWLAGTAGVANASTMPRVSCSSLTGQAIQAADIGLPTTGATVTSATLVPASSTLPEYCAILGAIHPVDPTAPDIDFGVDIPTAWNGMSWQYGGGGNDGVIRDLTAASNPNTNVPSDPPPLAQGYATYGSDSGHQGVAATSWEANQEAWMNFAYEQIKKTHDVTMDLMHLMYGQAAKANYWIGTSQGGREGLEAVTRYPQDYQGVAVSVPLAYFSDLFFNPPYLGVKQLAPGSWIPSTKGPAVGNYVLNKCGDAAGPDAGVVNNYLECDVQVDPTDTPNAFANLECPGGADTGDNCLSAAQLPTLGYMYGPIKYNYRLANHEHMYPGWGTGLEGSPGWLWSTAQPVAGDPTYGQGPGASAVKAYFCFRLVAGDSNCTLSDPSFSMLSLNLDAWRQQIQTLSNEVDVSEDISRWIAHGGKLIMITHASDAISNPRAQMMLYDRWVAHDGRNQVNQHVRYYVVPNQGHGAAGTDATGTPLPVSVDAQGMLQNWVEHGVTPPAAPDAVTESPTAPYTVSYSKPACLFPGYPKYVAGPITSASSYTCTTPLNDLAAQIGGDRLRRGMTQLLQDRVQDISRSLENTREACEAVNRLSATVLDSAIDENAGLSIAHAKALITTISAEKWAVGCLKAHPTDAGEQQLLSLADTLDGLNLNRQPAEALRDSLHDVAFGLANTRYTQLGPERRPGADTCTALTRIASEISALSQRRHGGLTAAQAAALQSGVSDVQSTLGCSG